MIEDLSEKYAVPAGSIKEYRYAVYFEGLGLWKETDPVCRANMARQLAEWAAVLAEMEAEEAQKCGEATAVRTEAA